MQTGRLNKRIIIEKLTVSHDEYMVESSEWCEFCTVWAYVNGLSGAEYWQAAALKAENTVVFEIRWSEKASEVTPQCFRVKFGGDIYNIQMVDNVMFGNKVLKIKAVKVV